MSEDSSSQLRVAIVVPAKKFLCLAGVLWTQRYGPLQVASVTRQAGYFVRLYNEELGLQVAPRELAQEFDVVGFSSKSAAMTRAEEIAEAVKREAEELGRQVVTVLGGEHISLGGESRFSPFFDYALRGESEGAFLQLLKSLEAGGQGAADILNTSLNKTHVCESFDNIPDLSLVAGYDETARGFIFRYLPLLWMLKKGRFPILTFQGSRGCPYNCSFCPTSRLSQGNGYRRRSVESSIEYLKEHLERSGVRRVMFEDPTAALPFDKRSHMFFGAVAENGVRMKATLLVRADICEDIKLLEVMKGAGVINLSVGIESLTEQTLSDFKKKMSYDTIRRAMDIFHEYGFGITGLFIVGYDTDEPDTFGRIRNFIRQTGIEKWRVSPLSQMPESADQFMPAHRYFLWNEFSGFGQSVADYCNGEFVIFYPKRMKPSTLQKKIMDFNRSATTLSDIVKIAGKRRKVMPVLQRLGNNIVQRIIVNEVTTSGYLEMIEDVEGKFYIDRDGNEELQEDLLRRRYEERASTRGGQLCQASSAKDF